MFSARWLLGGGGRGVGVGDVAHFLRTSTIRTRRGPPAARFGRLVPRTRVYLVPGICIYERSPTDVYMMYGLV